MSTVSERPLRADAARNRARVLDAARVAFAELGGDAQMEDVARRAGVGVGTVYRHFPTKAALIRALTDLRWHETVERLDSEAVAAVDPWEGFAQMFRIAGELHERDRAFAQAVTEILGGLCEGPPAEVQNALDERADRLLERAHAAGVLRADVTRADLRTVFCSLAAINRFGVGDWRRHLDLVLAGLRAA